MLQRIKRVARFWVDQAPSLQIFSLKRKRLWSAWDELPGTAEMKPKNEAFGLTMVRITQIVNGQKQTVSLSQETAVELGFHSPFDATPFPLSELLRTLFGPDDTPELPALPESTVRCPACGTDFEKFKQTGRLGCGDCYEVFRPQLEWILEELHGASRHVGCTPDTNQELARSFSEEEALTKELEEAIAAEDYERAAEIRDKLIALESEHSPASE